MTDGGVAPSWITMRIVVVVLAFTLGGCSFLTARLANDPRRECSRSIPVMDAGFAVVGFAGMVAATVWYAGVRDGETHTDYNAVYRGMLATTGLFTLLQVAQAYYGFDVAAKCRAERARLETR